MHRKKPIGTSKEVEDPSGGGKSNNPPNFAKSQASNKKEPPPAGLPTIGQNSGIYVKEILKTITAYCQLNGLADIVESLHDGAFAKMVLPIPDETKLTAAADPHGFYKNFMSSQFTKVSDDFNIYLKSKARLSDRNNLYSSSKTK